MPHLCNNPDFQKSFKHNMYFWKLYIAAICVQLCIDMLKCTHKYICMWKKYRHIPKKIKIANSKYWNTEWQLAVLVVTPSLDAGLRVSWVTLCLPHHIVSLEMVRQCKKSYIDSTPPFSFISAASFHIPDRGTQSCMCLLPHTYRLEGWMWRTWYIPVQLFFPFLLEASCFVLQSLQLSRG